MNIIRKIRIFLKNHYTLFLLFIVLGIALLWFFDSFEYEPLTLIIVIIITIITELIKIKNDFKIINYNDYLYSFEIRGNAEQIKNFVDYILKNELCIRRYKVYSHDGEFKSFQVESINKIDFEVDKLKKLGCKLYRIALDGSVFYETQE